MGKRYKYGRTPHLPWSEKLGKDDRVLDSIDQFIGQEVVVSIKLDGENTTMYKDHIHARSIDSKHHPSRDWVKGLLSQFNWMLDEDHRICGENMFAKHYKNLSTYFYVFSMWRGDQCLSWENTLEYCDLFNLTPVPVLYQGIFDYDHIRNILPKEYNGDPCEGYVIRLAKEFKYEDFSKSLGKFVSSQFQIVDTHWMYDKIIKNELKNEQTT